MCSNVAEMQIQVSTNRARVMNALGFLTHIYPVAANACMQRYSKNTTTKQLLSRNRTGFITCTVEENPNYPTLKVVLHRVELRMETMTEIKQLYQGKVKAWGQCYVVPRMK